MNVPNGDDDRACAQRADHQAYRADLEQPSARDRRMLAPLDDRLIWSGMGTGSPVFPNTREPLAPGGVVLIHPRIASFEPLGAPASRAGRLRTLRRRPRR